MYYNGGGDDARDKQRTRRATAGDEAVLVVLASGETGREGTSAINVNGCDRLTRNN